MKYSYRITNIREENEEWVSFDFFHELEKFLDEMKKEDTLYILDVAIEISPERIIVIEGTKRVEFKGWFRKVKYSYELDVAIGTDHSTDEWYILELEDDFENFYQSFESAVENPEFIDFSSWKNDSEHLNEEDRSSSPMAMEF